MQVVQLKDDRRYRLKLLNHFQRCSLQQLKEQAKWWLHRDAEIYLVITTEIARR